jgi:hypothetical protein
VKQRTEAVRRCYMRICPQEHGAGYQGQGWEDEGVNHVPNHARSAGLSTDTCGMSVVCLGAEGLYTGSYLVIFTFLTSYFKYIYIGTIHRTNLNDFFKNRKITYMRLFSS